MERVIATGRIWIHLGATLSRLAIGFTIGATVALGVALGVEILPRAAHVAEAATALLYSVPKIAILPMLIVWLGLGEAPKLLLLALAAFFPVFMMSRSGLRGVDAGVLMAAAASGLHRVTILRYVRLPLAGPVILSGLRVALGYSFIMVVTAELFATTRGLGYLILEAAERFDLALAMAAVCLLSAMNLICAKAFLGLEQRYRTRMLGGSARP